MQLKIKNVVFYIAIVAIFIFSPLTTFGEETKYNSKTRLSPTESTVIIGYGRGSISEGSYENISLIWHLGFDIRRFFPRLANHRGIPSFYLEPKLNPVISPEKDIEVGISFGIKYMYPLKNRLYGYIAGSVGPHLITVQTEDQANGFIFFDTIGTGLSFFLTKKSAINLEYRLRHISSASIKQPNGGINSHISAIGYSLFF